MRRSARQTLLIAIAVLFAATLALFLANPGIANDPRPPEDLPGQAAWIREHPADWFVASAITEGALDASLPRRRVLWRASYDLARHLAPRRRNPPAAFVRGGLFHWYELDDDERKLVLREAAPLLRDPKIFADLHGALWQLTRDFSYLRRNGPDTIDALESLRVLALTHGQFAEYRQMRDAVQRKRLALFEARKSSIPAQELLSLLPRKLTASDEPLIRALLQELEQRSYAPGDFGNPMPAVIDYAITHALRPLDALAPFVETPQVLPPATRARLALALGKADAATAIDLGSVTTSPEWIPYFLERALFEARRRNAAAADLHLRRASMAGIDERVLATAEVIASSLGNTPAAAQYRTQLATRMEQPAEWKNTCGTNELCDFANTTVYVTDDAIRIDAEVVQTDQNAPYIEIYVDDERAAEGDVRDERRFVIPATKGAHQVEVRLVNSRMGNGTQRRVRLSRSTTETAAPRIAPRVTGLDGMKKLKSISAWTMAMVRLARAAA